MVEMSSMLRLGVGCRGGWRGAGRTGRWLNSILRGRLYSSEAQQVCLPNDFEDVFETHVLCMPFFQTFEKILIANRGEIACRVSAAMRITIRWYWPFIQVHHTG